MDPNSHFSSSTSNSNHTNNRSEKEDVAKSEPAVTLHYAALPDKVSIKNEHVAKIMGMVPYDYEEVKKTWEQYKKEVRAYAVDEIKKRILKEAQTISDEGFLPVLIRNGEESRPPRKFNDIMLWWRQLFDQGDYMITDYEDIQAASQTLNHLQNGMWKKYWAKDMEIDFMQTMNWCYDEESYNQLQRQCKRTGFEVIGCVAKNIAAVKGEIVKYWQRSCRNDTDSRVYVYKSRPTTSAYGKDGKYVKLEKGEFTFTIPRKTTKPAGEKQLPVLNHGKVGITFVHFSLLLCSFFPFQLIYIYIFASIIYSMQKRLQPPLDNNDTEEEETDEEGENPHEQPPSPPQRETNQPKEGENPPEQPPAPPQQETNQPTAKNVVEQTDIDTHASTPSITKRNRKNLAKNKDFWENLGFNAKKKNEARKKPSATGSRKKKTLEAQPQGPSASTRTRNKVRLKVELFLLLCFLLILN
jgi:hypothetical protein